VRLDPGVRERDPAARFTICRPEPLQRAFDAAGLHDVRVELLDIETHFADLRDYWDPFLAGAASPYLDTISALQRRRLRADSSERSPCNETEAFVSLPERGPSSGRWQRGKSERERERGGPCGARTRDRAMMRRRNHPHTASMVRHLGSRQGPRSDALGRLRWPTTSS
jgi:hypothetical protein